ncbi:MAG: SRPBCC family protein [Tepidiformaceae bacterium]
MTNPATLQVTTPTDREIVITRDFNARRDLVFDAHTKPELVKRWMFGPDGWTFAVCEIDLRVGGKYRFVWRKGTEEMGMGGVYREVARPERLVSNELFDEDWTGGETLNTMVLIERDAGTRLTTTLLYSSKEARDGALQSGMDEGMEAGYARLDAIFAE